MILSINIVDGNCKCDCAWSCNILSIRCNSVLNIRENIKEISQTRIL